MEGAGAGAGEARHPDGKVLTAKQRKKWLKFQEKLKAKYGGDQVDGGQDSNSENNKNYRDNSVNTGEKVIKSALHIQSDNNTSSDNKAVSKTNDPISNSTDNKRQNTATEPTIINSVSTQQENNKKQPQLGHNKKQSGPKGNKGRAKRVQVESAKFKLPDKTREVIKNLKTTIADVKKEPKKYVVFDKFGSKFKPIAPQTVAEIMESISNAEKFTPPKRPPLKSGPKKPFYKPDSSIDDGLSSLSGEMPKNYAHLQKGGPGTKMRGIAGIPTSYLNNWFAKREEPAAYFDTSTPVQYPGVQYSATPPISSGVSSNFPDYAPVNTMYNPMPPTNISTFPHNYPVTAANTPGIPDYAPVNTMYNPMPPENIYTDPYNYPVTASNTPGITKTNPENIFSPLSNSPPPPSEIKAASLHPGDFTKKSENTKTNPQEIFPLLSKPSKKKAATAKPGPWIKVLEKTKKNPENRYPLLIVSSKKELASLNTGTTIGSWKPVGLSGSDCDKSEATTPPHISKRSAFERLGPIVTEPKKPKLTINLIANEDNSEVIREVVEEHIPVYLREDIVNSKDEIVMSYLKLWPWLKDVTVLKEASALSKDLLFEEYSDMLVVYESKSAWIKVVITGYPPNFKKEDVLDMLLSQLDDMEFVPCFIEFSPKQCTFLVNRCEKALTYFHKNGLLVQKDDFKLSLTIGHVRLTLNNLPLYKGSVLKSKLFRCYNDYNKLDLEAFFLQSDNSHIIYYPLSHPRNQISIINNIKLVLPWEKITTLILSGNRLKSIASFGLDVQLPQLKVLDLSNNLLPTASTLICCKGLGLTTLTLEGNPLCLNFIEQDHYTNVVKQLFSRLQYLDGVDIFNEDGVKKNFSVSADATDLVAAFLEIYFTLIDSKDQALIENMYDESAVFSITCRPEMRRNPMYRNLKEFYMWCRKLDDLINPEDPLDGAIVGSAKIIKYFSKWPVVVHDPYSFTVDVLYHTGTTTILKVTGLFKVPAESLTLEEPVIEFSRTFVLATKDGVEYKIMNDMMYISDATKQRVTSAFQCVGQQQNSKDLNLTFDNPPDDYLRDKLTLIFMELTGLRRKPSERCLEMKNWDLRQALETFIHLEKLDETGKLDL